jgi:serine O-acetyltransferase
MSSNDALRPVDGMAVDHAPPRAPAEPSLFSALREDFAEWAARRGHRFPSVGAVLDALFMPGIMATIIFRVGHSLHRSGLRPLSRLTYIWNVILFGCDIAPGAVIGPGLLMPHPVGVGVGRECRLGSRVKVLGGVRLGGGNSEDPDNDGMPTIGDDCWLLDGSKAFGKLTIGEGSVLAASAVLFTSIPPRSVAVGIPARVIRTRPVEAVASRSGKAVEPSR